MAGKYKGSMRKVSKDRKEPQKGRGGSVRLGPKVHRGGKRRK